MINFEAQTPPQNERQIAGISHLFVLIPYLGFLAPYIIWAKYKNSSEYIAFQSLQALVYQLIALIVWLIGVVLYYALPIFGIWLIAPTINLLVRFTIAAYGIFGAVMAFQGKPFRYWFIGDRIERQLSTISNRQWLVQFQELQKRPAFPIIIGFGVTCVHLFITPFFLGSSFASVKHILGLILVAPGFIPVFISESFISSITKFIDPSILEILFLQCFSSFIYGSLAGALASRKIILQVIAVILLFLMILFGCFLVIMAGQSFA